MSRFTVRGDKKRILDRNRLATIRIQPNTQPIIGKKAMDFPNPFSVTSMFGFIINLVKNWRAMTKPHIYPPEDYSVVSTMK